MRKPVANVGQGHQTLNLKKLYASSYISKFAYYFHSEMTAIENIKCHGVKTNINEINKVCQQCLQLSKATYSIN